MKGHNIPFKKNMIQGVSIVAAVLVLGIFMVYSVKTLKSYDNTVTVRGLCEREVPADRVVLRVNYTMQHDDLGTLRSNVDEANRNVVALLKKAGFSDDEIKYMPASVSDNYQGYYSNNVRFRYRAEQLVSVFTSNVEAAQKVRATLDADLLKQNVISSTYAVYEYNGLNDIKPSMIAESLQNARAAADEFAKNSHSKIGKMRTATQGYFTVDDLDENTPQVKKVRVVSTVEYYLK